MQKISTVGFACLAVAVLLAAAAFTTTVTVAQSTDCLSPLLVCLPFLYSTNPSADCCNAIENELNNSEDVACLCYYYNNPGALQGFNITQALMLPGYCGLSFDPNTLCKNNGDVAPGGSSSMLPPGK